MQKFSEVLNGFELKQKKKTSERAEIIKEIYELYISKQELVFRKKDNWKRYIIWLKSNRFKNTKENQDKFRKSKFFLKAHDVRALCFFLGHIPTPSLYHVKSVCKDKYNRREPIGGYLFSNLKSK